MRRRKLNSEPTESVRNDSRRKFLVELLRAKPERMLKGLDNIEHEIAQGI